MRLVWFTGMREIKDSCLLYTSKGVHSGTYMALLTAVVISGVKVLFGRNILSLFVSGEQEHEKAHPVKILCTGC